MQARGNSGQANGKARSGDREGCPSPGADNRAQTMRKRLIGDRPRSRASTRSGVRAAVVNRTGKSIDDLTADELGPLVEAAANKLREMKQAQAA